MKQYFAKLFFKSAAALLLLCGGQQLAAQPIQPLLDSSDVFYGRYNFKKALEIAKVAGAIALRDSGEKSKVYAKVVGEFYAMNFEKLSRFDSAEFYYKKGIDIYRELGVVNDTVYATVLINLGNLYNTVKQMPNTAGPYFDEAYPIIKQYMSRHNTDYAATINNMGLYYYHNNQFSKAEPLYLESLELMERYHPDNLDTMMFIVVNLVEMYKIMSAYNKAYVIEYRYLSKLDPFKVKDKRGILSGLMQLNELALYMAPTRHTTDSINSIMERMKQGNADTIYINACITVNRLRYYLFMGKPLEAIKLYESIAERGYERYFAGGNAAVIDIVPTMLDVYIQAGKMEKALALFETVVYTHGKWQESNIVRKWMYMQHGTTIYTLTGNRVKAKDMMKQLIEFSSLKMYPYFATIPDYMRWALVRQLRVFVSAIAFYINKTGDNDQEMVNLLFDYQLRYRGTIVNEKILLHKYVRQSGIDGALDSLNLLNDLQNRIAKLYVSNNQLQLSKLERRASQLDAYLRKLVPAFANIEAAPLTRQALQRQLKPNEVVVDFIRFGNIDSAYRLKSDLLYGALVLTGTDTVPKFVSLCREADFISIFEASNKKTDGKANPANLVKETMQYKGNSSRPLTEFYKITWQKLEKYFVPGKTKVYYIPNGQLCVLPMEAFGKGKGNYIRNTIEMEQLQSYLAFAYRDELLAKKKNTMELWGDIDYGEAGILKKSDDAFVYLGKAEVNNIMEVLTGSSFVIRQYLQGEATENLFKKTRHKDEVVHLSTHGFYKQQLGIVPNKTIGFGFNRIPEAPLYSHLLYSGLAFAGANKTKTGDARQPSAVKSVFAEEENDGILYSYEIKDIDMTAADLVVLSACETGLGMIILDEGVMGLQQAFRLAGASKVIMSLWEVDKQYTADWMKIFYSYYKGDAEAAFNNTQNQLIAEGKPPYNWAGFVLIK
jgi:CHAT domain-containing protein